MGLKLKEYINDSNRKLDKETVRKHLVDILNYTVEENSFLDQMTVGKRLYSNQYKNSPSVSLTVNHKIKINEVPREFSYKFSDNETQTFNLSNELGVVA
ncbi:transcription termination factor NusB [Staphylococcus aureus]|nr:transcription termination factor NusB [Staphylococcus aureus]